MALGACDSYEFAFKRAIKSPRKGGMILKERIMAEDLDAFRAETREWLEAILAAIHA